MDSYDVSFNEQIEFLLEEFRNRNITVHELMKLIKMAYGDYMEFHPEGLPKAYEQAESTKRNSIREESSQ